MCSKTEREVIQLSMIFKISGNYVQDGSWANPDPAFEGEILIDDAGKICGYCMDNACSGIHSVVYREKYLLGSLGITSKHKYGIAFRKFSDHPYYSTKMYLVTDMDNPDSAIWAEQTTKGVFLLQGMAKVKLEKMPYYEDRAEAIRARFEQLSTLGHGQIEENIQTCAQYVASVS